MRHLLSENYFPFGSQYYRAPSPPPEDWEGDLKAMADLGFNSVKYWVQWRWNHPEEDRFYFDDIDRLMDLSEKYELKVMLNTIVDVAPAWIYKKYPDASMLTLDGRRIGPQSQPHRQIGGLGLCLNHEKAVENMMRFLRATFERYSDHPALEIWNFGSEPELTQSMSEMRAWADDASKMGDMMCHCDLCHAAFRTWLGKKYGHIDELNKSWNRNYTSFEEAELPKTRNTFNDIIDWRMFFVDVLGENVRRRYEVCKEIDGDRHPQMCHHVFIQGFPITSTANDPWNVAEYGDLHGFTQMDDPMMHDILRSSSRGKPVISAEMLMLMGYTLDLHEEIDANDIKRHIFTGVAANLKGFIFWQYRPEMLGREAPAWGLSHLDGSTTPWLESFAECGRVLQEEKDFLFEASPSPADVAILYNPENQVLAWASSGNEKSATDSMLGVHRALYEQSHRIDFLHPKDIREGHIDEYRVVMAPLSYLLTQEIADALKAWVKDGGVLIAEAYLGGWNRDDGRHNTTIPGYGLHEVFQVRQKNAEPANDENRVRMTLEQNLPGAKSGTKAFGSMIKETYFVEGAEVLAKFADGQAAITQASYGNGKAILIGSYAGLSYHRDQDASTGSVIAGLVDHAVDLEKPQASGNGRVRVDTLSTSDGGHMVILQNMEDEGVKADVGIRLDLGPMREVFGGDAVEPSQRDGRSTFSVKLGPHEVRVYRA